MGWRRCIVQRGLVTRASTAGCTRGSPRAAVRAGRGRADAPAIAVLAHRRIQVVRLVSFYFSFINLILTHICLLYAGYMYTAPLFSLLQPQSQSLLKTKSKRSKKGKYSATSSTLASLYPPASLAFPRSTTHFKLGEAPSGEEEFGAFARAGEEEFDGTPGGLDSFDEPGFDAQCDALPIDPRTVRMCQYRGRSTRHGEDVPWRSHHGNEHG